MVMMMTTKSKPLHRYHNELIKEIDDAEWLDKEISDHEKQENKEYLISLTNGGKTYRN